MTKKGKIEIEIFISYAHSDDEYSEPFLADLKDMVAPSKKYHFKFRQDHIILPGETWDKEIRKALKKCALGLFLVSPAFLASSFITEEELPQFIGEFSKPVIPVMLRKVNLKLHDLNGLQELQLFRLKAGPNNFRSYAQCGSSQKSDFVYALHEKIEARLNKLFTYGDKFCQRPQRYAVKIKMKARMKLKFEGYQINNIASRYDYQRDEDKLINLKKVIQRQGHLNKKQLQLVAKWKAPRNAGHVQKNTNEYVKDVTAFAFSTKIERSRIETLTILDGISWPTASVLLHLFHEDPYPILDFRALWSASLDVPKQYSFGYWSPYVLCRTALVGDRYAEWCGRAPQ